MLENGRSGRSKVATSSGISDPATKPKYALITENQDLRDGDKKKCREINEEKWREVEKPKNMNKEGTHRI